MTKEFFFSRVGLVRHQLLGQSLYHRLLSPRGAVALHPRRLGWWCFGINSTVFLCESTTAACRCAMQLLKGHYQYHHPCQRSWISQGWEVRKWAIIFLGLLREPRGTVTLLQVCSSVWKIKSKSKRVRFLRWQIQVPRRMCRCIQA